VSLLLLFLIHARVPLLGTDARKSNMKKKKKMGDIGRLFLTKSRKELAAIRPQELGPQLQAR
jgi:hypothetical protein